MIENIVPFDDSMVIEDYNNLEDDFKRSFFLPERGLELDPTSTTSKPTEPTTPTTNSSEIGVSVVPTDDGGIQRPVFLGLFSYFILFGV